MTEQLRDLDGDPPKRLTALMLGLGTLISEHPQWVRILLRDEAALPEDVRERDHESRMAFLQLLMDTLAEGGEMARSIGKMIPTASCSTRWRVANARTTIGTVHEFVWALAFGGDTSGSATTSCTGCGRVCDTAGDAQRRSATVTLASRGTSPTAPRA